MNASSVLPPFIGQGPQARALMSPYDASMLEVVQRYGTSPSRVAILRGLLSYRSALLAISIVDGYQWLDGSFVEDVEATRKRAPEDIDLVTFAHLPGDRVVKRQVALANASLFSPELAKQEFQCDAYFVDLDKKPELLADDVRYWFGLFSHQRVSALWKGMLKVPMQSNDAAASALLDHIERVGGAFMGGIDHASETGT